MIYIFHYALNNKLHIFLGNPKCKLICRRCLSFFEEEHVLKKDKDRFEQQDFTSIKHSNDKYINWKKIIKKYHHILEYKLILNLLTK